MQTTIARIVGLSAAFTLVGALPAAAAEPWQVTVAAKGCSGRAYGAPSSGEFGSPGLANQANAGYPGYRQFYRWSVEGDVGRAAVQLRGYENGQVGEKWYGVGLWESGSGSQAYVPWGNSLSTPAIRVAVPFGSPGVFVSFAC